MKFPFFPKKDVKKDNNDKLSNFLLHASDEEKRRIFLEAARLANKDQRELVERSSQLQNA